MFGEHNFAGKTFLEEVGNMPGLEVKIKDLSTMNHLDGIQELDLTRVDGIESMDQFKFARGNALKSLTLSGCNLKHLNKTSFAGLDMLETVCFSSGL
jgi:hypothetical protein